ncbi:hypothetical protein ACIQAL_30605 [Pseudomonas sp. NPDC088368]|uniref:hypothetical protein n=1 Tax=Pseudomonas sp. NPDC088368 TaxID=3364453 RepID=UPI00382A2827
MLARDLLRSGSKSGACGACGASGGKASSGSTAAARQIVGKPTPTAFGQNQQPELRCTFASAEGVGALLARDLLRSGSKSGACGACGASGGKASSGSTAAARQIVGEPTPTASGQNQKPEQRCTFASPTAFGQNQKPEQRCTFASAEGVGALLARDLLRSGSNSVHAVRQAEKRRQVLPPLRARS